MCESVIQKLYRNTRCKDKKKNGDCIHRARVPALTISKKQGIRHVSRLGKKALKINCQIDYSRVGSWLETASGIFIRPTRHV